MTAADLLPPIPQPPHDPKFLLLNGRAGWREKELSNAQVRPSDCALVLTGLPGSARSLLEPSGSFGGLVPPSNVAIAGDGSIYLLHRGTLELKRFDNCCCRFDTIPCTRQFNNPGAIAICAGNLFVCDTGNQRVLVFSLRGMVLRAAWKPPVSANLVNIFTPVGIAIDGRGRVFVSDPANAGIHRFHPSGRWEKLIGAIGVTRQLAIDCSDRIFVVVEGETAVRIFYPDGTPAGSETDPAAAATAFPSLPFQIDAAGNLHLGAICTPPSDAIFTVAGNVVKPPQQPIPPSYFTQGVYYSLPLDSLLYRCQWHRIVLRGKIPKGTRVIVSTFTAKAELPGNQILQPEIPWETNQTASEMANGEFDCLVANKGGRYLWLRLVLRGNGFETPFICEVQIDFPRISLRRFLPAAFGEEPSGADFTDRFLSIFDTTLRGIESIIDDQAHFFDPRSTPATIDRKTGVDFLSWLATWIGVTLNRQLPEQQRRESLLAAGKLFPIRGTREGLHRQLLFLLGLNRDLCCPGDGSRSRCVPAPANCAPVKKQPCFWEPPPLILEHFQLRRWLFIGSGRLGDEAELWGRGIVNRSQLNQNARVGVTQIISTQDPYRDPFHVYAHKFSVFVPACVEQFPQMRRALVNLLEDERPAHTSYQLEFVGPRFCIGFQSTIGFNSVVGKYPEGVTLGQTPLGRASVFGPAPGKRQGPSFEVGRNARIGSTTALD